MIQRLLELMKIKNLTSSQLADAIGVQRSGISHFFSGRNKPSLEFILKILAFFPDVNPDWLLFGKEPVFRKDYPGLQLEQNSITPENAGIPLSEELPVPQSSFMEDLFGESAKTGPDNVKEEVKAPEKRSERPKRSPLMDKDMKNDESSVSGALCPEALDQQTPERIVIFYKNRIFREYLPG